MAWHSVVAGACLVLGAVDVVWLGNAAEDVLRGEPPRAVAVAVAVNDHVNDPPPVAVSAAFAAPVDVDVDVDVDVNGDGDGDDPGTFTIHFGRDEDTLGDVERAALDELAPRLTGAVAVDGHADERGSDDYNHALSRRRAERVAEYLEAHGALHLTVHAFGESKPLGSPHLDRRVEIHQEVAP